MERLGEVDEARDLVARIGGPAAAVEERVAGQHRDRPAVEAGEARHHRAAPHLADLEEAATVDAGLDDRADAIDLATVARDGVISEASRRCGSSLLGWRSARPSTEDGR